MQIITIFGNHWDIWLFLLVNKIQGAKIFFWPKTMCIAENYLKNCIGSYFEWSDLMLALWRKEPSKCRVFPLFALNKPKFRQNGVFATKISWQCKHQITYFEIESHAVFQVVFSYVHSFWPKFFLAPWILFTSRKSQYLNGFQIW